MGSAWSKPAGQLPRAARQTAQKAPSDTYRARPAILPAAEGARPPPIPHEQTSPKLHASEFQDAAIVRDGSDPQMATAPEPRFASQLAALGPVDVSKPRLRLSRNDRMLEILAGREREASLDPQEVVAAQLRGKPLRTQGSPTVPLGSRTTKATRLEASVLVDLLSTRTQATLPRHITALAQEFGLDENTVEALGRRFGVPQLIQEGDKPSTGQAPQSKSRTPSAPKRVHMDGKDSDLGGDVPNKELNPQKVGESTMEEQRFDVPNPEEAKSKRKLLVWVDVPEIERPRA